MRIPTETRECEIEIKRSKFITYTFPVETTEDVKRHLKETWGLHPQASHVVQAYILGDHGDIFGMSDDHEPKNTAGRPALEVLKGSGLTRVLVLIVRYFGGTKLGTGGLVKAYTLAAQEGIARIASEELVDRSRFSLEIPYELYTPAQSILADCEADALEEDFGTVITIRGRIPASRFGEANAAVTDRSAGKCSLTLLEPHEQQHGEDDQV